jgi:hypothetical protein
LATRFLLGDRGGKHSHYNAMLSFASVSTLLPLLVLAFL